jgi:hypothetical protein
LDHILVWGPRHLERIVGEYVSHYNQARPHRSLQLRPPNLGPVTASPQPSMASQLWPGRTDSEV